MNTSSDYSLSFTIVESKAGGKPIPRIIYGKDENGYSINGALGAFFCFQGAKGINEIKENVENILQNGIFPTEFIGPQNEGAAITDNPFEISFHYKTSNELVMPLEDFLEILDEWLEFLDSIPFEHILTNM